MKEKMKLTELTRDELQKVSGGRMGAGSCDNCNCSQQQEFGNEDSNSRAKIIRP